MSTGTAPPLDTATVIEAVSETDNTNGTGIHTDKFTIEEDGSIAATVNTVSEPPIQ